MQNNIELLILITQPIIYLIAFLLGKYVFPKYKDTIQTVATQFDVIFKYAESFCAYARQL